jgi:fatty acyl-CoA reductase
MRSINLDFASKLNTMEGDISKPNFGLTKADEIILTDQCHIVFHAAASIQFNQPLKYDVKIVLFS